jgi:UDP-glucose 4-epimerase
MGVLVTGGAGYIGSHMVLEVIAAVKRASGTDFAVRLGPPRPGDPTALVAEAHRIGEVLGWRPSHDDLDGIVADALGWERRLVEYRAAS